MSNIWNYETEIDIPYGKLGEIIDWCKDHCEKDWGWIIVDPVSYNVAGKYSFKFESEKDYFTFLVWKR